MGFPNMVNLSGIALPGMLREKERERDERRRKGERRSFLFILFLIQFVNCRYHFRSTIIT